MQSEKHKVFVSYHHMNDQWAMNHLRQMNHDYGVFEDMSVDVGEISDARTRAVAGHDNAQVDM